jgi:HK97 family phage major capsid protein
MPSTAYQILGEAEAIFDQAKAQNRELTPAENTEVQRLQQKAHEAAGMESKMDALLKGGGGSTFHVNGWGDRFVQSPGWKSIANPASRGATWSTGMVEVGSMSLSAKGTLLEGSGSPGSGTGGGFIPVPDVASGIVEKLFQPLSIENLLSSSVTTSNTVRYAVEGTATSGAAGVAEGGDKPQSTIAVSTLDEPIKKIATTLVVSDELTSDATAVQGFINSRLGLFVRIEAERQILRGTSGGNEVQGLLTSRGVPIYAGGTAAGNKAEQLFKAANGVRGSAFVEPEWIVMHPTDWEQIRLGKDNQNQYYGGGPFLGAYGNAGMVGASGQISGAQDTIWNKPVYVTATIGAGTALIGNSQAARIWNNGGLSVEVTNSHSDFFFKDLVAVRAERRLGITVFRPSAFCEVRLA